MRPYLVVCAAALAAPLAAQGPAPGAPLVVAGMGDSPPPVLQSAELPDSLVFILPGFPTRKPAPDPAPETSASSAPASDVDHRPLLRRVPKPILPAEFERESAVFTQKMIGSWTQSDAYNLYGAPLRERPVFDDNNVENGRVFAYSDPTGRYREIELDFARDSGILRTVFVYPWKMSWQECRRLWGANVRSTQANKGRTFYSYVNRRLDVLVDRSGAVISLGLY